VAKVITLTNQKGGVGKTTTTCSLAAGLADMKYRVLAIDLDPQGNLGFCLGLNIDKSYTIYDVLKGDVPLSKAIQRTQFCDVITSNILLSSPEVQFSGPGRESLLKNVLEIAKDFYDFIIIDTPPALNLLTVNAYIASDYLIIPMLPEVLSILGLTQLSETIESVKESFNPNLSVLGILLTKYNARTTLAREVEDIAKNVAKQIGTDVFNAKIATSVAVAEAPAHGLSIYKYAPRCNPSKNYRSLVQEVLDKIN